MDFRSFVKLLEGFILPGRIILDLEALFSEYMPRFFDELESQISARFGRNSDSRGRLQVGQGVGLSPPVVGDLQPAVASLPHYRKAAPLRTHCGLHRRGAGGQAAQEQGDVEGAEFDRSWPCRGPAACWNESETSEQAQEYDARDGSAAVELILPRAVVLALALH